MDYYPFADTSFPEMENAKAPYMQEWQHYTCAKPKREPYLCNGPFDFLAWLFGIMEFGQRKEFFLRGNKRRVRGQRNSKKELSVRANKRTGYKWKRKGMECYFGDFESIFMTQIT